MGPLSRPESAAVALNLDPGPGVRGARSSRLDGSCVQDRGAASAAGDSHSGGRSGGTGRRDRDWALGNKTACSRTSMTRAAMIATTTPGGRPAVPDARLASTQQGSARRVFVRLPGRRSRHAAHRETYLPGSSRQPLPTRHRAGRRTGRGLLGARRPAHLRERHEQRRVVRAAELRAPPGRHGRRAVAGAHVPGWYALSTGRVRVGSCALALVDAWIVLASLWLFRSPNGLGSRPCGR